MNLLLDTNIILNVVRAKNYDAVREFINPENLGLYTSIVVEAEIRSLVLRHQWGASRINHLNHFLDALNIIEVNEFSVPGYVRIDSYSQRLNPNFGAYPINSARNMGKNDLWIASLAALFELKLVTTDADFDHLHKVFFEVRKIKPEEFDQFR